MGKNDLAPGFRFRPTDVELVRYYLKRKVLGKKLLTNTIAEIDIYKFEPPDLPDKSCLRTGDLKWYFFCPREKKYPNSSRVKRSTESGYWKTSGKDRDVSYNNEVIGKIRTLIYHFGRKPRDDRTNWVLYEYRLEDKALAQKNVPQDAYVLCALFKKNGLGPRHGSEYGAPFKEEDWSDDEEEEEEDTENIVAIPSAENADPGLVAPKDGFTGVISESCVSVLPPVNSDVVACAPMSSSPLLEVPQAPLDDNEFNELLDHFFVYDDNDELLLSDGIENQNEVEGHEPGVVPVVEKAPVCLGDGDFSGSENLFIEIDDLIEPVIPPPPAAQASNPGDSSQTL